VDCASKSSRTHWSGQEMSKSNASKLSFLDSVPSQLRFSYLSLKKKNEEEAAHHRDRDKDMQDVIQGGRFGYLSSEKISKNIFEPENCFLRFDPFKCKLLFESEELPSEVKPYPRMWHIFL
jgi:hypothetical protein